MAHQFMFLYPTLNSKWSNRIPSMKMGILVLLCDDMFQSVICVVYDLRSHTERWNDENISVNFIQNMHWYRNNRMRWKFMPDDNLPEWSDDSPQHIC